MLMTQLGLGLDLSTKRTRKREFLDEMRRVVPWSKLIALIEPHYPKGKTGRPPFPVATMLQTLMPVIRVFTSDARRVQLAGISQ
jgi:hypothetical protein